MYSKLENKNVNLRRYTSKMQEMFSDLIPYANSHQISPIFKKSAHNNNPLIILVASSRGLCGSFNTTLFRHFEKDLSLEKEQTPKFIAIGQKSIKFLKDKNIQPAYQYAELNTNNFIKIADDLTERISGQECKFSSVVFYSNIAKNFFIQRPQTTTVVPLPLPKQEASSTEIDEDNRPLLEQPLDELLQFLSVNYLRASLLDLLFQSLKAEHSARFLAMDSSTSNAENILDSLTLQYNKLRQALITREVAELSAGFSAK